MSTKQKYSEALATITLLQERFPQTFFVREVKRKPLKIGIDRDVIAQLNGALRPDQLTAALRSYVGAQGYLAALRPGATRIDLNGEPCGQTVSAGAAKCAAEQLANKMLKADARRKARMAEERPPCSGAGGTVAVKPSGRLSLRDLKQSALARRA